MQIVDFKREGSPCGSGTRESYAGVLEEAF